MRYLIALVLLMPFFKNADAQDTLNAVSQKLSSREKPRYKGGEEELRMFLALNLRYPNDAFNHSIEGEVIVSFKIDEEGKVSDVVSKKQLGYGCDEEAVRVVKKMPNWIPAKRNGKKISVIYNLPVVFELPNKDHKN